MAAKAPDDTMRTTTIRSMLFRTVSSDSLIWEINWAPRTESELRSVDMTSSCASEPTTNVLTMRTLRAGYLPKALA